MSSETSQKVEHYFSRYPLRTYPKGQILLFAGENPVHIFYLKEGSVRKYDVADSGNELVVNVFKSGSFFPLSWALNKIPNKYFYKTDSEAMVSIAPTEDVYEFVTTNPDVLLELVHRLYSDIQGIQGRLVQLMGGSAYRRVVYELLIDAWRFGKNQPDGTIVLTASESDIAARSGLSRETVSREVRALKNIGAVALVKHTLVVLDLPVLEHQLTTPLQGQ